MSELSGCVGRSFGGYIELEDCGGHPYHRNAIALDSARSCLAYLVELREIRSIAIPDLMCDVVAETLERRGVEYRRYKIGAEFEPILDFDLMDGEWLYLSDYFGRLSDDTVQEALQKSRGRLVIDEVQGFFRAPWSNIDTFYTCRKYFGVPDGAYLVTRDGSSLIRELPECHSINRMSHILGRCEMGPSAYYGAYVESEQTVGGNGPERMSEITRRLLSGINYESVKKRREENYGTLDRMLGTTNPLKGHSPSGPYMYPYLVENASGMRSVLAEMGIFIPTLWPNVLAECSEDSFAFCYAENILPLPVDQRYDREDMEYIAAVIGKMAKDKKGK